MTRDPGRRHTTSEYVRWSDVDASSIIRWSAYTRFVELAETEFFRTIGFPYATLWNRLDIWLPRVQFHLDCRNPARLDEVLRTGIWVARIGHSSMCFNFAMEKPDGLLAAEGYLVVVAVGRKDGKKVEVPAVLAEALNPYLASEP